MKGILQTLLALALTSVITPKVQHRSNDTSYVRCSLSDFERQARCSLTADRLVCVKGFERYWLQHRWHGIEYLQVLKWPGNCIDVSQLLYQFPELKTLEFVNCTLLKQFTGRLANSTIKKISLHGLTSLWEFPPDIVKEMSQLREIDLRRNALRHMRALLFTGPPRLQRVYLSGNLWDCSDGGLDWLAMESDNGTIKTKIVDYYELTCHQQLYRGKPLHKVMDIIKKMRETCPDPCTCVMTHVVSDAAGDVIPLITVDCSGKGLESPPAMLPPSTSTLRLEDNKITSIRSIVQSTQYKRLVDLYLDNNSLSSVKELEGSEWFNTFRVLSLRGNYLKQIPVYAFDKAIQGNNDVMHVFLGHNPWRCDCHFIPRFQGLLLKFKRVIKDAVDIRCPESSDKKTSLVQISKMSLGNVCAKSGKELPISTVNIVNIALFSLILLVLGKFLYDWHNFKRTGKLPWLSSILP